MTRVRSFNRWACLGLALAALGCSHPPTTDAQAPSAPPVALRARLPVGQHTRQVGRVAVDVRIPADSLRGTVLVLPGWNFSRTLWCDSTQLCRLADSLHLALVLPEMGRSIYASRYYPETRADYRRHLTLGWVTDTLLAWARDSLALLRPGQPNYLLGLSTGARGVALIALATDTLFRAGIALSGDYDPRAMPADNLLRNTYGPYERFPSRWAGPDNPTARAAALRVPLYLGHGQRDRVVPWQQTQLYADSLRAARPTLPIVLHLAPTHRHDFTYWGSELAAAFAWALTL